MINRELRHLLSRCSNCTLRPRPDKNAQPRRGHLRWVGVMHWPRPPTVQSKNEFSLFHERPSINLFTHRGIAMRQSDVMARLEEAFIAPLLVTLIIIMFWGGTSLSPGIANPDICHSSGFCVSSHSTSRRPRPCSRHR